MQTRQLLADTAGITTRGARIELPAAEAPAATETLAQPAAVAARTPEELINEFIRLGREGNQSAIQDLVNRISRPDEALSVAPISFSSKELQPKIEEAAAAVGLDARLLSRLVKAESNGNQAARSPVGAIGLTQLMPATAQELGVDPENADENLFGGALYLARQMQRFGGDARKALAAYNWGPHNVVKAVNKYGAEWDQHLPEETEAYINKIAPRS